MYCRENKICKEEIKDENSWMLLLRNSVGVLEKSSLKGIKSIMEVHSNVFSYSDNNIRISSLIIKSGNKIFVHNLRRKIQDNFQKFSSWSVYGRKVGFDYQTLYSDIQK